MFTLILQDYTGDGSTISQSWFTIDKAVADDAFENLVTEVKKNFLTPGGEDYDDKSTISMETDSYVEVSDEDGIVCSVALVEALPIATT